MNAWRATNLTGRHRRHHGFAAIMAISLIILVGAALVVVSSGIVADVKKTRNDAVDAQLRELLIAGEAVAARDVAAAPDAKAVAVALPPELAAEGAALKLTPARDGEKVTVGVDAEFAHRRARQVLTFTRDGDRWKLVDARLD